MIISHSKKFMFFELPRTGTTSIRNLFLKEEICENFKVDRHISISNFLDVNRIDLSDYKIVCCIRNPMDRVLSQYLKMKIDQNNYFSKLILKERKNYFDRRLINRFLDIKNNNLNFEKYFLKYYKLPYTDWMYLDYNKCDFIIRFENLNEDFKAFKEKMSINTKEELPVLNKIIDKKKFTDYYTPKTYKRAIFIFALYMKKFGYSFPIGWPSYKINIIQKIAFIILNILYSSLLRYKK